MSTRLLGDSMHEQGKLVVGFRWLAILPGAILAAGLSGFLMIEFLRYSITAMTAFDPDGLLGKAYITLLSNGA